jgi:hypothetical protein
MRLTLTPSSLQESVRVLSVITLYHSSILYYIYIYITILRVQKQCRRGNTPFLFSPTACASYCCRCSIYRWVAFRSELV